MTSVPATVAIARRVLSIGTLRSMRLAVCLGVGWLVLLPQPSLAQGRKPRASSMERRHVAPLPLEAGMAHPISQPYGTVPPLMIGPAPAFYAGPVMFVPPPGYAASPEFGPSPFLPPPGPPLTNQPVPLTTNFQPLAPVAELPMNSQGRKEIGPSNLRVSVSEAFLNRLVAREEVQPGPIQDHILGAQVTGRQTTATRLKIDLVPSADQARAAFVLTGDVQTLTTGVTPQAMIDTAGQQQFLAVKEVFFDGRLFSTKHATVSVRARNQTIGAMTPLSGSLFGGLADRIAYRAAERRKPESEAIARERVVEKVYPAFDGEIDMQLASANQLLEHTARKRLEAAQLAPASQAVVTTDTCLTYAALIGNPPADVSLSPLDGQLVGDGGMNLSIHESLLNDLIGRTDLRGFKTNDKDLKRQTADLLALLDGVKVTLPDEAAGAAPLGLSLPGLSLATDIVFDETDPVILRFDRDRLTATIRAKFKPAGQDLLPPMLVLIEYRAVIEGNTVRYVPAAPRVVAQSQNDLNAEPTLAEKAVQQAIAATLPTLEFDRALPSQFWTLPGPAPRVASIKYHDGWVSIAID